MYFKLYNLNYDEKDFFSSVVLHVYHCTLLTDDIAMISANNDNATVLILICQYDFDSITIIFEYYLK